MALTGKPTAEINAPAMKAPMPVVNFGTRPLAANSTPSERTPVLTCWSSTTSATMEFTITRSEEHTSELQSLMRISYAVFCLKTKKLRILQKLTYECVHQT